MLVKFFRRGIGAGSGPIDYLLGEERTREGARVLYGDPIITEQLINATPYKQKYKAGVLSFEEQAEQLSEAQKQQIMQGFEKTLFVGLEPDQYDILWVEHTDKGGRLELNFLIPGQELRSGKRLQPFYAKADLVRVNAFKNIINHQYGFSSPDEPKRKRWMNPYTDNGPRLDESDIEQQRKDEEIIRNPSNRQELKDAINNCMLAALVDQRITNRYTVVRLLKELGLQIKRQTTKSISVAHPKMGTNIRLKGEIYQENFHRHDTYPKAIKASQLAYDRDCYERQMRDEETWLKGLKIKEKYHKELYGDIQPPEPLIKPKGANTLDFTIRPARSDSEPFNDALDPNHDEKINSKENKAQSSPTPDIYPSF